MKHQRIKKILSHTKTRGGLYLLGSVLLLYFVIPWLLPIKLKSIENSSLIYDRNGIEIGEIIYDGVHRHQRLDLKQYPDFLKDGIITIEDKRFWRHN